MSVLFHLTLFSIIIFLFFLDLSISRTGRQVELRWGLLGMEICTPIQHAVEPGLYRGLFLNLIKGNVLNHNYNRSSNASSFSSLLDQRLCRETLDNRQHHETGSAELPTICDLSEPARLHVTDMEQLQVYQWVFYILTGFTCVCIADHDLQVIITRQWISWQILYLDYTTLTTHKSSTEKYSFSIWYRLFYNILKGNDRKGKQKQSEFRFYFQDSLKIVYFCGTLKWLGSSSSSSSSPCASIGVFHSAGSVCSRSVLLLCLSFGHTL